MGPAPSSSVLNQILIFLVAVLGVVAVVIVLALIVVWGMGVGPKVDSEFRHEFTETEKQNILESLRVNAPTSSPYVLVDAEGESELTPAGRELLESLLVEPVKKWDEESRGEILESLKNY